MALKWIVIETTDSIKTINGAFADEATQSGTLPIHRCSNQTSPRTSGKNFST
jgi:hypothetical protein